MYHSLSVSLFFFSSRRRHTRCLSDWSSDVCSSDLCDQTHSQQVTPPVVVAADHASAKRGRCGRRCAPFFFPTRCSGFWRSEERRVGKEWSYGRAAEHEKTENTD